MVGRAVELPGVVVEAARPFARVRAHRARVAHDGEEPDEEQPRRDDERREREGTARTGSRRQAQRTARKPANGIQRKIAYVGWTTASTSDARPALREEAPARAPQRRERERERGGHEQLARRRRGQRERGVGAAVPRGHRRDGDGGAGRGRGGADPPEQRVAGLVRDEHGEGCEHRRLVEHDLGRVGEGDLRDEREEACQSGKA